MWHQLLFEWFNDVGQVGDLTVHNVLMASLMLRKNCFVIYFSNNKSIGILFRLENDALFPPLSIQYALTIPPKKKRNRYVGKDLQHTTDFKVAKTGNWQPKWKHAQHLPHIRKLILYQKTACAHFFRLIQPSLRFCLFFTETQPFLDAVDSRYSGVSTANFALK